MRHAGSQNASAARPVVASPAREQDRDAGAIASYDFTKQVGHMLRKAYQAHVAVFQKHSAGHPITVAQFPVLCALRDYGPCSLALIGRTVVMDPATTREIVQRLSGRGLVSLSRDSVDRRRVIVSLEEEGKRLLERMIPTAIDISAETVQSLSPAEQVALNYLLEKISEASDRPVRTPVAGDTHAAGGVI